MLGLFLSLAQAMTAVPAYSPPASRPHYDPAMLSIVVADTVKQTDPRPLCARPDCTAMFLGTFMKARTLAGLTVGEKFAAGQKFAAEAREKIMAKKAQSSEAAAESAADLSRELRRVQQELKALSKRLAALEGNK